MTATATSRVRAEKQAYQSNDESWGTHLNAGVFDIFDDARGQWVTRNLTGNYTLDVQNFISDEARAPMFRFTGTGTFTVTAPAVSYWYIIRNDCTGDLTVTPSGGTGAVIRAGRTAIWTTDGTTAYVLDPRLNELRSPNASVDMGGQRAINQAAGSASTDGATLSNRVHEFALPTAALAMNGQRITGMGAGTAATDGATLSNRLDQFAAPTASVSFNSQRITNLGAPTASTDAATRGFVLSEIAAAATINLPPVAGNAGRILATDGAVASWTNTPSGAINWSASVDIASAATTDLATVNSNRVRITGTTTITSFGSGANLLRQVRFAASLTLTHNATTLVLPGGANIVTAADDTALCVSDGSGNWSVVFYQRANGLSLGSVAASRLIGRGASGTGLPEVITLGTGLSMAGSTLNVQAGLTLATAVATTSGSVVDFTGIPATARMILVMFSQVSLSAAEDILVQVGTSGGVVSTGYTSRGAQILAGSTVVDTSSAGFVISQNGPSDQFDGIMQIACLNASTNIWVSGHSGGLSVAGTAQGGGNITLAAALDRVRITRTGTATFDAGSVNISYI